MSPNSIKIHNIIPLVQHDILAYSADFNLLPAVDPIQTRGTHYIESHQNQTTMNLTNSFHLFDDQSM
jgi:hypothetical protein